MWSGSVLHKASSLGGNGWSEGSADTRQPHSQSFSARPLGKPRCRAGADLPFRLLKFPEGPAVSQGRGSPATARGRRRAPRRAAQRRAALWNTEFNRNFGGERTPDQAGVYLVPGAGQGRATQDFVIKPRPDRRRHLRTWTSGRTLARVSVPQRGVRGTQNYSSPSFAAALRHWEPTPDSALTPAPGSAPPSLRASPENRRALPPVPTVATEHPPSLPACSALFPHAVRAAQQSGLRLPRCLRCSPCTR